MSVMLKSYVIGEKNINLHPLPFNNKKKNYEKNERAPPPPEQSKNKLKQHTLPPSTIKSNLQKL